MLPTRPASPPPADYTLFDLGSTAETADILARPYLHEFLTAAYQDYDVSLSAFALLQQDFYLSAGQCPCLVAMSTLAFFYPCLNQRLSACWGSWEHLTRAAWLPSRALCFHCPAGVRQRAASEPDITPLPQGVRSQMWPLNHLDPLLQFHPTDHHLERHQHEVGGGEDEGAGRVHKLQLQAHLHAGLPGDAHGGCSGPCGWGTVG